MEEYIAKSNPQENIRQHTDKLLSLLEGLVLIYPEALSENEITLIRIAAEYHDYGKASYIFQRNISEKIGIPFKRVSELDRVYKKYDSFPHGYLSPAFLPLKELRSMLGDDGLLAVVNAIYFHHTRQPAGKGEEKRIIEADLKCRLGDRNNLNTSYLTLVQSSENPPKMPQWLLYAVIKGTLNRLDYAASSGETLLEEPRLQDGISFSKIVETKLTERFSLRPVQEYMKANRDKNLVVTASTGIGKTEAACLWAGGDKLFYTLPLKVSINAIYKRLKNSYGFNNCALLHSDALNILLKSEEESDNALEKYDKTQLFSYPVTVCTVDQLFTFVYRFRGCEIIPAVLKYSRVVIDEIQSYSPDIAAKLIIGLERITTLGGKFAVITATMPPFLEAAMTRRGIPYEKPEPFYSDLARHFLCYLKSDFDYARIVEAGRQSKVLVICNTVSRACKVYQDLKEENIHLLHARFKLRDRGRLEKNIMDFSESREVGIWVTTQIVEASLDIDFDYLFTEMCPADSLLQRLGRCWRKREYTEVGPNVFIYDTGNGMGSVYDEEIYSRSVEKLPGYCGHILTEKEKNEYICSVYDCDEIRTTKYYKKFSDALYRIGNLPPSVFSAQEALKNFRDITSVSVIDDEDYNSMLTTGEIDALGEAMCSKDRRVRANARQKFFDHTISINLQYLNKLRADMNSPIVFKGRSGGLPPVFRVQAKYDFDESTGKGQGLILELDENQNFI